MPGILTIIGSIATANSSPKSAKSANSRNRSPNKAKKQVKSLYDLSLQGGDLTASPTAQAAKAQYELAQDYERLRVVISDAGVQIENVETLLDLVLVLTGLRTDGDLGRMVYLADLSPTTMRVLAICSAIMAPKERVWRPKDTCLVSASLDTERIKVITRLQRTMREYQQLLSSIMAVINAGTQDTSNSNNNRDSNATYTADELASMTQMVNKATEQAFEDLAAILGSIPKYMDKLQTGKFEEFSQRRLEEANEVFQKLNRKLSSIGNPN